METFFVWTVRDLALFILTERNRTWRESSPRPWEGFWQVTYERQRRRVLSAEPQRTHANCCWWFYDSPVLQVIKVVTALVKVRGRARCGGFFFLFFFSPVRLDKVKKTERQVESQINGLFKPFIFESESFYPSYTYIRHNYRNTWYPNTAPEIGRLVCDMICNTFCYSVRS